MIVDLFYAALSLEIFIFSILAHELGHLVAFRILGIKPKLNFRRTENGFKFIFSNVSEFKSLHPADKLIIYSDGVCLGWSFLLYSYTIFNIPIILGLFWAVVYILGCKSDIKNMTRLWKEI